MRRCFSADVLSVRPVFVPVKDHILENGRDGGRYDETDDGSFVQAAARLETPTIHHGRHTFISHALAGGRSLAEVRDAAGHANVSITSGYLHVAVDDEGGVGNLFERRLSCLFRNFSGFQGQNRASISIYRYRDPFSS